MIAPGQRQYSVSSGYLITPPSFRYYLGLIAFWLFLSPLLHSQGTDLGTEAQINAGKELYQDFCAHCHGDNGDGKGSAFLHFAPKPRDFTSGKYKVRTTPSGELPTTGDIKHIIRVGMPFSAMPAFSNFNDEEITNLVYYLKTFNEDFEDPDFVPVPIDFEKAPKYSEESATRGRDLYVKNECYTCHGDQGRSDGVSAPTLEDDFGPEKYHIRPADLTKRWSFRGGPTRKDIYRTFTTGLNGTPMPSYQDSIPENERWDLVNYIYSLSERDETDFSTTLVAEPVEGDLDPARGKELFANATISHFPVVGQVIEPGRLLAPSTNAIEVQAVYNAEEFAILVTWHDMTADTTGENAPDASLGEEDLHQTSRVISEEDQENPQFSDAIAIQWPQKMPEGFKKPYFLFGDAKNAVNVWFVDLAQGETVKQYTGNGFQNLIASESNGVLVSSKYENGEWSVIFKQRRDQTDAIPFVEGEFLPLSFFVWDGFNRETGVRTGITPWYSIYLTPADTQSPIGPMLTYGFLTLLAEILIIFFVRRKYTGSPEPAPQSA